MNGDLHLRKFIVTAQPFPQSTVTADYPVSGTDAEDARRVFERTNPSMVVVAVKEAM